MHTNNWQRVLRQPGSWHRREVAHNHPSPLRWLALMRFATLLLPTTRADWAIAMQSEIDRFEDDRDALAWAFGCVIAGCKERFNAMFADCLKISPWILAPEMLLCFTPLTIGWLDGIGGDWASRDSIWTSFKNTLSALSGGTLLLIHNDESAQFWAPSAQLV